VKGLVRLLGDVAYILPWLVVGAVEAAVDKRRSPAERHRRFIARLDEHQRAHPLPQPKPWWSDPQTGQPTDPRRLHLVSLPSQRDSH